MPSWKKVIISGSDAALNSITIDNTDARLVLDRNAVSNDSEVVFTTNGTENWSIGTGQVGGDNDFTFRSYGSSNAIRFNQNGHINAQGSITGSSLLINSEITSVSASVDYLAVNDRLQGNGSGFQFFAYNEDTVKVKFANWYSSNDRQYGMGQLWYETWFAAIDNQAGRDNRRIGFYLEEPDAGSTDSGTPGQHPSNARFYVDINGAYLSGSLEVSSDITGSDITIDDWGSISASLASIDSNITLQDATDNGNTTTNSIITTNSVFASTFTGSLLRLDENGTGMRITNVGGFEPQSGTFNIFGNDDVTFGAGGSGASHRVLTMYESDKSAHFANNVTVTGSLNVGDGTDINLVGGGNLETNGGNVNTSGGTVNTNGGNIETNNGNVELGTGALNGTIPGSAVNVDTVTATIKNFVIDHPTPEKEGYKLRHSSLEGPEIGVYFRGKSTSNIIDLPDYWADLVEEESITVNLTPFGSSCQHYIEDIRDNQVIIGCACGTPNYHFTVYGERKDVEKLVVEYKEEKYL